ncbi:MAG: permease [Xanthobacteraceae bacterium]|nr:permease [Xanthobacteraceae bacterium]
MRTLSPTEMRQITWAIAGVVAIWGAAVVVGAETGFFASLHMPLIAAIVAATIILPTLLYLASPRLQAYADSIGHRPILLFHTWRLPAAMAFFWYGAQGHLPTAFWVLAGVGDFLAGSYAAWLAFRPESARRYLSFHIFGFADFVVAVGTGLAFTLMQDPRMALIAALPMALIPLWGVGISGVTHLIAFDMLRRSTGSSEGQAKAGAILP